MAHRYAVTGALSYTGRYIAKRLFEQNKSHEIVNLSRRSAPIALAPLSLDETWRLPPTPPAWDNPELLRAALRGCDALFATYFVRFVDGSGDPHARAAANLANLFDAAAAEGVKVVFSSHTRTSLDSPFSYIAGKARAEQSLRESGANYAIVRPCGIFGDTPAESILMNNAAWVLRRSPLFLTAGDGGQPFQPVHVRDMAALMVKLGQSTDTSGEELDACGPDAPTALELFTALRDATGAPARVAPVGGWLSNATLTALTRPIDWVTGDTLLDADDLDLLGSGLTRADDPDDPRIQERRSLMAWIKEHGAELGQEYVSSRTRYYAVK
mmetsp:Transcript_7621/g.23982  ORF Transcript_7621/g.23982 Transcript_7621/m.23982 type:complete len:327 (-) Transcript_7621:14-994(-)